MGPPDQGALVIEGSILTAPKPGLAAEPKRGNEMADHKDKQADVSPELDETRREALAKMGRLAGYTAPAMLVLLGASKARAQVNGSAPQKRDPS
jgi:hypothetical protein